MVTKAHTSDREIEKSRATNSDHCPVLSGGSSVTKAAQINVMTVIKKGDRKPPKPDSSTTSDKNKLNSVHSVHYNLN